MPDSCFTIHVIDPYSGSFLKVKNFHEIFAACKPPLKVFSAKFWACHTHLYDY